MNMFLRWSADWLKNRGISNTHFNRAKKFAGAIKTISDQIILRTFLRVCYGKLVQKNNEDVNFFKNYSYIKMYCLLLFFRKEWYNVCE